MAIRNLCKTPVDCNSSNSNDSPNSVLLLSDSYYSHLVMLFFLVHIEVGSVREKEKKF